jgi:two-component system sensor histidine kinase HydH
MFKRLLPSCLAGISILLLWFTVGSYRNARPLADEMLFGIAHSLHAAIEFSVFQDPSLRNLSQFRSHDIVYFSLVDGKGVRRFHSNSELVGTQLGNKEELLEMSSETMTGKRVRLDTGEEGYELLTHVHVPDGTLGLRLVLHTYRADAVIRSARINMVIMVVLLVFSWCLAAIIYRYARREDQHRLDLARQDNLARMGEMGATLAHEIRNPLAGIKGFAQLIEINPDDPRTRDSAQRIVVETHRLEELTTDLLAFARSDDFPVTLINVSEFIEQVVVMVHLEAGQAGVAITMDCIDGLVLRGNRDRLAQVVLNVVRNSVQAMPDGGTLSVVAVQAGLYASITISDSGCGISPDSILRVFEPFFTTKARGTGLGLALCKKIIEEHNGAITIESSSIGTTVTLLLPVSGRKEKV